MGRQESPRSAYIKTYYRKKEKNRIKEVDTKPVVRRRAIFVEVRETQKNAMKTLCENIILCRYIPGIRLIWCVHGIVHNIISNDSLARERESKNKTKKIKRVDLEISRTPVHCSVVRYK